MKGQTILLAAIMAGTVFASEPGAEVRNLQRNAAASGTIPYEMLTSVSPRVKRVYFQE